VRQSLPATVRVKLRLDCAPQLSVAVTVAMNVPSSPALAMVTTPARLMLSVPMKSVVEVVRPAIAETVRLTIAPLSEGATLGVTVVEAPATTLVAGCGARVGGALVVTFTPGAAVALAAMLSVTVKVKLALDAVHEATTRAIAAPAASTLMSETVTPPAVAVDEPLTVTTSVFAA